MKTFLFCLLVVLTFSCRKDVDVNLDNFIEIDGVQYLRRPDSKGKYQSDRFPPYYQGVTWSDGNEISSIEVSVVNTCNNNRGLLSDFHGYIQFRLRNGQDSVGYYGKFPLFEVQSSDHKTSISFKNLKIYRFYNYISVLDMTDSKTVSGKVTFQ